jgi:hypothetical protein
MNKEAFAQKLLVALGHSKFELDVSAIKMLDSASWIPQVLLSPIRLTKVEGAAKADQLKAVRNKKYQSSQSTLTQNAEKLKC